MSSLITNLRRLMLLVLLASIGGAGYSWWRSRTAPPSPPQPVWPPLDPSAASPATAAATTTASTASASPDGDSPAGGDAWVAPNDDGSCPVSHPIKANDNSGIFHLPGGRFYDRTGAERCYSSAEAAIADGYRQSKS